MHDKPDPRPSKPSLPALVVQHHDVQIKSEEGWRRAIKETIPEGEDSTNHSDQPTQEEHYPLPPKPSLQAPEVRNHDVQNKSNEGGKRDARETIQNEEDPTGTEQCWEGSQNKKEKGEDDDDKLKSTYNMQINQRVDPPIHMKLEQQPEGSRFLLRQVREAAYSRSLPLFQYFMIRPFSERIIFIHIGGF